MKRFFFIAAIAGAALVSCTKNEVAQSVNDQTKISFSTPVVGATTKASETLSKGLLTGVYPTGQNFSVWAWYNSNDGKQTNIPYMTDVEVKWNKENHNDPEPETGAWDPITPYYWPKDGKLDFDAYSPSDIQNADNLVECTPENGLTINNYSVPTDLTNQIDILFSDRAEDKTSSIGLTNEPYNEYEGVDIVFNHALSAVAFTVQQAGSYTSGAIKIKDIIVSAYQTGTFNQNLGSTPATNPAWTSTEQVLVDYNVVTSVDYDNSVEVSQKAVAPNGAAPILVLPQEFSQSEAKITVNYYIQNGDEEPLLQTVTFELNDTDNQGTAEVNKWEMGKKYTYNITIGLNAIYFAPTIDAWDGVNVTLPGIE